MRNGKKGNATIKKLSDVGPDGKSKIDDRRILSIDIGGSKVKMLVNGETEPRKAKTGPDLTPKKLVQIVNRLTHDWKFDSVSIGFPGIVGPNGPLAEPGNLGPGWIAYDFASAFDKPVKVINDAAMQAMGAYEGGRMLFLGFGTGLGSTLIINNSIISLEFGCLRWTNGRTIGELVSKRWIREMGLKKWRRAVNEILHELMRAVCADYIVVGGGNAKLLKDLPAGVRMGHNRTAFLGGYRIWGFDHSDKQGLETLGYDWNMI